jgi:hypothetical protein
MGAFFSREDDEDEVKLDSEKEKELEPDLVEEPVIKSSKRSKTRSKRKSGGKTKRYRY